MIRQALLAAAAATMMAGTALTPVDPVHAQVPAFLPNKDAVTETEAMEIDGDWRVNTIGKVIRIERGRAYAVEGWTHAFVLRVQPDMVTIRNIRQIDRDTYVGDDLPMMGQVTMKVISPDRIEASVPAMFGPARYVLTRVAGASGRGDDGAPMFVTPGQTSAEPSPRREPVSGNPSPRVEFASIEEAIGELRPLEETFRGCEIPENIVAGDTLSAPATPRDRVTNRQFAPVAQDDTMPDLGADCWTRLDGVWRQNDEPDFDTSKNAENGWRAKGLAPSLLHGSYTTPETLFIAPGDDPERELYVMSGVNDLGMTRYISDDGQSIASLIGQVGQRKTYRPAGQSRLGQQLIIDYTAGGDLRIRLGGRQFLRPETAPVREIDSDDVFALQYQTDNFAGNLKGYDVLTQDPFRLMQNPKNSVFARRALNEYRIQEKFAVPFGFSLKNVLDQGTVYRSSMISSAREMQSANSLSFGVNANVSVSGAVNTILSFSRSKATIADTGYSVGYASTNSSMQAMRSSGSVARAIGFSRAMSYAIILDHSDAQLSADFLTAVSDAQLEGRYDELIDRFGTHYAYAVTYGANGRMTRDVTTQEFQNTLGQTNGNKIEGEVRVLESSLGGFVETLNSNLNTTSGAQQTENGFFEAVGGNGSWSENGFARGERVVPILLDLRPLDELLNPINFPDQPDVYTRVRIELAQAINGYLAERTGPLSSKRLISDVAYIQPDPDPSQGGEPAEPIETWHVYVRQIACKKPGPGTTTSAFGNMNITAVGSGGGIAQPKKLEVACKWRKTNKETYSYRASPNTPGLMILNGTRAQMQDYLLKFDFNWQYQGKIKGKGRNDSRSLNSTPLQTSGLAVGKSHTTSWTVGPKGRPELTLSLRVKRIK